jgi:hypothetical protein
MRQNDSVGTSRTRFFRIELSAGRKADAERSEKLGRDGHGAQALGAVSNSQVLTAQVTIRSDGFERL